MTTTEIIEQVKRLYPEQQLDVTDDSDFTVTNNPNILFQINRGQEQIARLTECLQAENITELTADTESFSLPSTWLRLRSDAKVWVKDSSGNWSDLTTVTRGYLDVHHLEWFDSSSSDPIWCFTEDGEIHVYPQSDTTVSNGLKYYGYKRPSEVSGNSDIPFDSKTHLYVYHPLIVEYIGVQIKIQSDDNKDANNILSIWRQKVMNMKIETKSLSMGNRFPQMGRLRGYWGRFKR